MSVKNQLKTAGLLGVLTAILIWAGSLFGGRNGLFIGLVIAIVMNFGAYWFSDRVVLAIYRAKEVKEKDNPGLYRIVREVSGIADLPMPKVYIIPSDSPNAFATGRNPQHSAVACTIGILNMLDDEALKGVIAHEISHIRNRDTLIQAVASTIAGVISYLAMMARWGAIFGGFGRDRDSGNMVDLLALAIITPLLAMIIKMAISRSREYLADETAAKMLKNPLGLANALEKMDSEVKHRPMRFGNTSTSSLFIVNPFRGHGMLKILSTHPPVHERVKRLRSMKF